MNVQGLGNKKKRLDTFNYIQSKQPSVIFLQDTHFIDEVEKNIYSEIGMQCFFNNYTSQARGVAIFINNTLDFRLISQYKDTNGNLLILNCIICDKKFNLINVYGPNSDDPAFFKKILEQIEYTDAFSIVAGDFNLILNPEIDCYDYINSNQHPKAREEVLKLISQCNLIDCWRDQNVESKEYTWFKKNTNKKARLDFFLISQTLLTDMTFVKILPGYRTDHSLLCLKLSLGQFKKGTSYWKMNNSLLTDIDYINTINEKIETIKKQYAVDNKIHDENGEKINDSDLHLTIDDQLFFETLLCELRGITISYSSHIKKKDTYREQELLKLILYLEKQQIIQNETLQDAKDKLEKIREKKMQGVITRSKAKWVQEGEKPTKYFCNLENRNFISKTMLKLISDNGKEIHTQDDILKETRSFYQKLYSKRKIENIDLNNIFSSFNTLKLSIKQQMQLEGILTYEECFTTLKNMNNNKSPGNSGFTVEFYKVFWRNIGHFLVRSINKGFAKGELSITQKQGVITCIPKGDKNKLLLKNWRPISLLNVCYKIASGSIANRLKDVLGTIINEDQTGFLKDRYIGENTRLIYDIMYHTQKYNKSGFLLLIDFEKAFDSIEWSFIDQVLAFYNFGPDFINWIKTFYKNIESCCLVNGHLSDWFCVQRGCRQGDPISSYIFILCAEILANLIRNDPNINGIKIGNTEYIISQFADDTTLILDGTDKSLKAALNVLKFYASISGLKVNIEKTNGVWIGSKLNSTKQLSEDINCSTNIFKALGITFSTNLDEIVKINYEHKIQEIKSLLNAGTIEY